MYFKSSFIEPNKFYINSILETFEKILENSLCRGGGAIMVWSLTESQQEKLLYKHVMQIFLLFKWILYLIKHKIIVDQVSKEIISILVTMLTLPSSKGFG